MRVGSDYDADTTRVAGGALRVCSGYVYTGRARRLTPTYVVVILGAYVMFANASIASHNTKARVFLSCAKDIAVVCIIKVVFTAACVGSSFESDHNLISEPEKPQSTSRIIAIM